MQMALKFVPLQAVAPASRLLRGPRRPRRRAAVRASASEMAAATACTLIRETLWAPPCPEDAMVSALVRAAATYEDDGNFAMATETLRDAQLRWTVLAGGPALLPVEVALFFAVSLGNVALSEGSDELARRMFLEAQDVARALPAGHPDVALPHSCLGLALYHLGAYDEAVLQLTRAREVREQTLGAGHVDTALLYNNLGVVTHVLGDTDLALEFFVAAAAIFEERLGNRHPRFGTALRNQEKCRRGELVSLQPFTAELPAVPLKKTKKKKKTKKGGAKKKAAGKR